jgi:hypothetical protein
MLDWGRNKWGVEKEEGDEGQAGLASGWVKHAHARGWACVRDAMGPLPHRCQVFFVFVPSFYGSTHYLPI